MAKRSPQPVDIQVGHAIRAARLRAGLSQTDLGNALGITFQQIQKYEKGSNRVGASRLTQISAAVGVPVASFFPTGGKIAKIPTPPILLDRMGQEVSEL